MFSTDSERGKLFRFLGFAVGVVLLQRIVLGISMVVYLHRHHIAWNFYTLLVKGYTHWDSSWYILLARTGYTNLKQTAFLPLYPMTMGVLHACTHLSLATCGILISLLSFVVALFFLGLVVEREFSRRTAFIAMMLVAFFPTSYYFDSVYTEAMFMALSLAAVYFSNTHRFWIAGFFAALATFTRNTGLLLLLVLAFDYLRYRHMGYRFWQVEWWRKLNLRVLGLFLPPVVLFLYCSWLKVRFGSFFAFLEAEHYWHRGYMSPWMAYSHTLLLVFRERPTIMQHSYVVVEAAAFTFAAVSLLLGLRHVRRSATQLGWWLYLLAVTWITSSEPALNIPDYLLSLPRFALMMFPGFVYLADVRPKWLVWVVFTLFAVLLTMKAEQFFQGHWIA